MAKSKSSDILKRMGANIRHYRTEQELSQGVLAMGAKITRESVNKIEAGRMNISVKKLNAIARALKVDITDLL